MDRQRQSPKASTRIDAVDTLERAAPWIVFGIIVALVVLSILSAALGTPWWR
jgi:hypothetical protein